MSTSFKIGSAINHLIGLLWGTKSSDATQGESVDVTSGALHQVDQTDAPWHSPRGPLEVTDGDDEYEPVAASQTAQVLGATGAAGDYIKHVLVVPATTSPGNILLLDNATSITIFTGGASSVADLKPFVIPLRMRSVSGAWKLTTGANVSAVAVGDFT